MLAGQGRSAIRRGAVVARLTTIAALIGAAGFSGSAFAGHRNHCDSRSSVSFSVSVGSGYSHCYTRPAVTTCYTRPAVTTCYTRPAVTTCYTRPAVTTCYTEPAVTTCYTTPSYNYSYSYPSYSYSYSYSSGHSHHRGHDHGYSHGGYNRHDGGFSRHSQNDSYNNNLGYNGGSGNSAGYGEQASYAQNTYSQNPGTQNSYTQTAQAPRVQDSSRDYAQWQNQVAQAGASRIEYGSYNPGPAQPSPAPVAQLARAQERESPRNNGFETGVVTAQAERSRTAADTAKTSRIEQRAERSRELIDKGWQALEAGKAKKAQEHFGEAADAQASAEARVGLALALASNDRHEAAAQAMRRALSSDADAFAALRESRQMKPLLGDLATSLRGASTAQVHRAGASPRSAPKASAQDLAVLLASVEFLNGDSASASITVAGAGSDDAAQALRTVLSAKAQGTAVASR